jgi:hypothetical protein
MEALSGNPTRCINNSNIVPVSTNHRTDGQGGLCPPNIGPVAPIRVLRSSGRLGGSVKNWRFDEPEKAARKAGQLAAARTAQGYQEVDSNGTAAPAV